MIRPLDSGAAPDDQAPSVGGSGSSTANRNVATGLRHGEPIPQPGPPAIFDCNSTAFINARLPRPTADPVRSARLSDVFDHWPAPTAP